MTNPIENIGSKSSSLLPVETLPPELESFKSQDPSEWKPDKTTDMHQAYMALTEVQTKDYDWRIENRGKFGWAVINLLYLQNLAVFIIVGLAVWNKSLPELQAVFGILVGATLTETCLTVQIIFKWLFSDVEYKLSKPPS